MDAVLRGFLDYGLAGLMIAALMVACYKLWKRGEQLGDLRVSDGKEHVVKLLEVVAQLETQEEKTLQAISDFGTAQRAMATVLNELAWPRRKAQRKVGG